MTIDRLKVLAAVLQRTPLSLAEQIICNEILEETAQQIKAQQIKAQRIKARQSEQGAPPQEPPNDA